MDATITAKGQITIPKTIRDHLKVKAGDRVKLFVHPDGRVVILPVVPVSTLRGSVKSRLRRPPTIEEMNRAIEDGAIARFKRSRER